MALQIAESQYMIELARAVGNMYAAVTGGVGDSATPGTAIFEIAQLQSVAQSGLPQFGIINDANDNFSFSYDAVNNKYYVAFVAGQVGYQGSRISVPAQNVPIKRSFGIQYSSSYQYVIRVGFPLSEAQKTTQTWSTVVSATAAQYATTIQVADPSIAQNLGFPILAHVGTVLVSFSGLAADGVSLQIDPSFDNGVSGGQRYGQIAQQIDRGSMVYFIYQPSLSSVCSIPVATTATSVSEFTYYPPLPPDWLPIADILVVDPTDPSVVEANDVYAITSTTQPWPAPSDTSPLFPTADANTIIKVCAKTQTALQQLGASSTVGDLVSVIEQFTQITADQPNQSFGQIWASQPFATSSYFTRGVGFRGLERPEFSDQFAQAYYALRKTDVPHTFAIFRGDLYNPGANDVGLPPTTPGVIYGLANWLVNPTSTQTLSRGTYTYGVSAVFSSGETAPVYASTIASYGTPTYFFNNIQFLESSGALYYHVYRRSNLVGDVKEYRLTNPYELFGGGVYSKPALSYAADQSLVNCVGFKFTAPSSSSYLDSVKIRLRSDGGTFTDITDSVSVSIYADTSGSPSGSAINTNTDTLLFTSLLSSYQDVVFRVEATLTSLSVYWVVISTSSAPSGANIYVSVDSTTGTNIVSTASSVSGSWTGQSSKTGDADLYFGFLDTGLAGNLVANRGVRLTGIVAQTPRRIRIFVPPIASAARGRSPDYLGLQDSNSDLILYPDDQRTRNELNVTVVAQNGSGTPVTFTATIPQYSDRGYQVVLGNTFQLFDRIVDVQVVPGNTANLRLGSDGTLLWSIYDLITVECVP